LCWQEFFLCFADTAEGRRAHHGHRTAVRDHQEKPAMAASRLEAQREKQPLAHDSQSQSPGDTSAFSPRFRSNSIDSTATDVSTASTLTTSGWKTPRRQERASSQSPGFSLGGLALDDGRSTASRRAFGQAQRNSRRMDAF